MTSSRHTADAPRPVLETVRVPTTSDNATTAHVLRLARANYTVRVSQLDPPEPLADWCANGGAEHALIGGFYVRPHGTPLGDLRIDGRALVRVPFDAPWDRMRACVHIHRDEVSLRARKELAAEPPGDLLQAGPMLARAGLNLLAADADREGFSAGAHQFDSDITVGRYPRAAFGVSRNELIAVVCDGRADDETGLSLTELAAVMIDLGADDAINLDGGGSASLVADGRLLNVPREQHGVEIPGGRAVPTALRFALR
jgi:hypothetical protein